MMGNGVKAILAKPIQLADQVIRSADYAASFPFERADLKFKTERLAALLRQAACAELYERPTRRIMDDTFEVLDKTLLIISKCRSPVLVKRVITIIPAGAFRKLSILLDNSLGDVYWLLRVSAPADDGDDDDDDDGTHHLRLPPIAHNEPILFLIWKNIAALTKGSLEARADAAASLCSLAQDNERFGKLIIEEDGVVPLLRLIKEGRVRFEGQEAAARAIGLLARDPKSIEQMVHAGVIRLLVGHLAFETVQEHSKYTIPPSSSSNTGLAKQQQTHIALSGSSIKGREFEDAPTKAYMKSMAARARALTQLAKGNPAICKCITESRALLCFAVLLKEGMEDVQYNSAVAVMEIARVVEQDANLRRSAFKPNLPAARAVINQLIHIVEKADCDDLLVPCIITLGCLSRTFRATETRIIGPLVRLLDDSQRDAVISREAAVTLGKFTCTENYLHTVHSKAIIDAGGVRLECRCSTCLRHFFSVRFPNSILALIPIIRLECRCSTCLRHFFSVRFPNLLLCCFTLLSRG